MEAKVAWQEGMKFIGESSGHEVALDSKAPLGKDQGFTPKELVAIGLGGCTAMDVIALLKKYRQTVKTFSVHVDTKASDQGHPIVFAEATLVFNADGDIEAEKLLEAVKLSQTKYCGVSAMLSQAFPLHYRVVLNGNEVGSGQADFSV